MSAARLLRDSLGASLVEFTVIMPVLFVLFLGTVDLGLTIFDYSRVSKAVYAGAHLAILSDPAASSITTVSYSSNDLGQDCANASGATSYCNSYIASSTCTATSSTVGSCTGGYTFGTTPFMAIVNKMQTVYGCTANSSTCAIQPQNVSIAYAINGNLGFVGQPNGLPMAVTVGVKCMYHTLYFIGALLRFTYSASPGCSGTPSGWAIPAYSTTLTSEDMTTN